MGEGGQAGYTEDQMFHGRRAMVLEGVFSRAMESVTGGVILAGFALALGASDLQIGLIAAIPFLAQLAHLPVLALLSRYPDRRPIAVRAAFASRALLLAIAAIPFFPLAEDRLPLLVALLVAYAVLATLSAGAWQVWVRELVPPKKLGRYFGRRAGILGVSGLLALLLAGQFLTGWNRYFPEQGSVGFSILYGLGALFGFASTGLLSRAPSMPPPVARRRLSEALREPLADLNYRRLLLFLGAWGFAANLALPFITIVLLRTMGYSLAVVTLLAAVSQVANILGFRLWAPLTDHFGNKPVLTLSASTFLLAMLTWAVLPDLKSPVVLGAILAVHVFLGLATSGLDLASNGIVMKLAPAEDGAPYLASASVVKALATGTAPLLGGLLATLFAATRFEVTFTLLHEGNRLGLTAFQISHYDFLFLLSAFLGTYALHRVLAFIEPGEAHPATVVRAMRREIGQVSSVAGMRQFAHVASYLVETAYRFEKTLGKGIPRGVPGPGRGGGGSES